MVFRTFVRVLLGGSYGILGACCNVWAFAEVFLDVAMVFLVVDQVFFIVFETFVRVLQGG